MANTHVTEFVERPYGGGGVILRLEVESVRHAILHHLSEHHLDLEQAVTRVIDRALTHTDWDSLLSKVIGEEMERIIHDCAEAAARQALFSSDTRKLIQNIITKSLKHMQETET